MPTALELLTELGQRRRELILSTPSSNGTRTTLIDDELARYMPRDASQTYLWVYGRQDVAASNRGQLARASSWDIDTNTLNLISPGMPAAIDTTGTYEIHVRSERARKLAALNSAVRLLGQTWTRRFVDESITTVANTWTYTLPSSANWHRVVDIDIQVSTDATLIGYPDRSADSLDWDVYPSTNLAGVTVWTIQFRDQPPPGYKLRIWGEAYYPDLAADTDILPLQGNVGGPAVEWIYDWATFRLIDEDVQNLPQEWYAKGRDEMQQKLLQARDKLMQNAPAHDAARIITPRSGQGRLRVSNRRNLGDFGIFSWGK